ncbi:MAG: hypothetical protein P8L79_02460 [Rhodospirillaceae bacterium]|jgi:hypothetical protein|nr:hypothetical protein [Rhodospirillaceae bacterium]
MTEDSESTAPMSGRIRLWYARVIMGLLMFLFLAQLYAFTPLNGIDMFGMTLSAEAHSITFLRTSLGAMVSCLFFCCLIGLVRPQHFLTCLTFVVDVITMIVALRLYGFAVNGITPKNISELRNEGLGWLIFLSGWIAYPKAKA